MKENYQELLKIRDNLKLELKDLKENHPELYILYECGERYLRHLEALIDTMKPELSTFNKNLKKAVECKKRPMK